MINQRRLLVVDDNETFRQALKSYLEPLGYIVAIAEDGKIAEHLLSVENFDAVITDIRMPETTGFQLLHFVKRTKPIPVIMMTGYPELGDSGEAFEVGASAFLSKPFKRGELVQALAKCFNDPDAGLIEQGETFSDLDFCKLSIDDFVSGKSIQSDIFVRLRENKYLKVAHQGENISIDRIKAYKHKGLKFLYMLREDFKKYVGLSVNLARALKSNKTVEKARKVQFLKHSGELIVAQLHLDGVDEASFDNARTVLDSTLSIVTDHNETISMLEMLSDHTDFLYAHSLGVSLYSTLIARAVGWNSPPVIFKISIGGLMHDIGKKEIPREIIEKPRSQLTGAEIKLLETHTLRGAELLGKMSYLPVDIIHIAAQHHENMLGLGYPAKLKGKLIHPLAKVVAVANEFCHLTIKNPDHVPVTPQIALEKICLIHKDSFDPVFVKALAEVFKLELPASYEEALKRKKAFAGG
jgi:putative nucleotidyltransferase with HDIG domain